MKHKISRTVLGVLFFGAFFAGGVYAAYAVATQLPLALAAQDWPTTQGIVVQSELRRRKGKGTSHRLVYSYEIDYRFFESRRVAFMGRMFRENAESQSVRYPEDQSVTVHYNPEQPEISVLETDVWWVGFGSATLMALVFVTTGGVGLHRTFK